VDVRRRGSGNIGATNVLRTSGWGPAIVTLAGDVLKGYLAARLGGSVAGGDPAAPAAAGVLPVVGNCWSVFLGGRGGKGVATGLGAFLHLTPWALLPATCVWLALVATFRFVSLGSLCAVLGLPLAILALGYPWWHVAAGAAVAAVVVVRHRENIRRLLAGTERQLGQRDQPAPPTPPVVAGRPR
jgi:glycerol-3-phosphate acyltransferase PlsY